MKKLYKTISFFLLISLLVPLQASAQFKIPPKPELQTSVYDYATVLNGNDRQVLENKLLRYSDSTSTQIVVITIESLKGESIGELTPRWAHDWGIGQADKDNGILILLAKAERKIWIAPGYGVDDKLTAGVLGQMIRDAIIPEFKTDNYYTGLDKGADAIFLLLKGKYKEDRAAETEELTIWGKIIGFFGLSFFIGVFLIFMGWLFSKRGVGSSSYSSSGKSSYKSKSSSGGGFRGGFGGGGFSGGGAGGSW